MTTTITSCLATIVDDDQPLSADELAHACGTTVEWVVHIVDAGVLTRPEDHVTAHWQFRSRDLRRALEARRLEQALDASPDAVALILDMSTEIRRLKAMMRAHGLTF